MSENGKAVIQRKAEVSSALQAYGDSNSLNALVGRLMSFHPAADEVGEVGMFQAAQLAILMGASPLPATNEIHIWKDKRGQVVVAPGVNYWRRRSVQYGGVFDGVPRPMTDAEAAQYGIRDNELGAICKGLPVAKLKEFMQMGISFNDIYQNFTVIGVGVVGKNEYSKMGRPLIWSALKRAETDFLKQAYPYSPGEKLEPGLGMTSSGDGYAPDESRHWAGLGLRIVNDRDSEGEPVDVDEVNEMLFGESYDETPATIATEDEIDSPRPRKGIRAVVIHQAETVSEEPPEQEPPAKLPVSFKRQDGSTVTVNIDREVVLDEQLLAQFRDAAAEGEGKSWLKNWRELNTILDDASEQEEE